MSRISSIAAVAIATTLAVAAATSPAAADVGSLATVGIGGQYSYVPGAVNGVDGTATRQYGLVGRLKLLRFVGFEAVAQLDQDAKTQRERHLSPRLQIGLMLNLIPTQIFNLFLVTGTGAHEPADLFNVSGDTTSFHFGSGLEVFVYDHVAIGGDLRFRLPGPEHLKHQVTEDQSTDPLEQAISLDVWQANITVSYYL